MKTTFTLLTAAFLFFRTAAAQEHADPAFVKAQTEHILNFHADIRVQKNRKVRITERIRVVAKGEAIQRGIYRDLPLEYPYKGATYTVGFEVIGIQRDGKAEDYHTESLSNGIRIYLGNKDVVLTPDIYNYEITYEVDHVLLFGEQFDELYWNINGVGWTFPVDSLSASVYLPEGAKLKQFSAYTGQSGEKGKDFTQSDLPGGIHFTVTRSMSQGENLTVAVAWDKNHLIYPTRMENFLFWLRIYGLWLLAGIGILGTLLYNFITWWRFGRDPKPGTIMPLYRAPDNLSPAECAFVQNEGRPADTMFGATLISLATKNYLNIKAEESGMIFKSKTFVLTKLPEDTPRKSALNAIESAFLNKLFGSAATVTISKKEYNPSLKECQEELYAHIDEKQGDAYFERNSKFKLKQYLVPFLTLALGVCVYFTIGGAPAALLGFVVMLVINIIFTRLYEQPTKAGRKLMDELKGFALYMQYADKERMRLMNPPTMNFEHFEENLPYAIALGVAENWAEQFAPAELQRMYSSAGFWYTGAMLSSFNAFSFSELSSTISSASIPPGTSSGSGGGGFSGGGGGGGGGGGW